jgi:hypothetical protein
LLLYELLDWLFYLSEECYWNFDRNWVEYIACIWLYNHFHHVDSASLWAWDVLIYSSVFLDFFLKWFIISIA